LPVPLSARSGRPDRCEAGLEADGRPRRTRKTTRGDQTTDGRRARDCGVRGEAGQAPHDKECPGQPLTAPAHLAGRQDRHGRRYNHPIHAERDKGGAPPRLAVPERELTHMAKAHHSRDHGKQHDTEHGREADPKFRRTRRVSLHRHRRLPTVEQERLTEDEGMCVWFKSPQTRTPMTTQSLHIPYTGASTGRLRCLSLRPDQVEHVLDRIASIPANDTTLSVSPTGSFDRRFLTAHQPRRGGPSTMLPRAAPVQPESRVRREVLAAARQPFRPPAGEMPAD